MAIQSSTSNQPQPYPTHFKLESVVRPNILALHPYRCARDDYSEGILLDANENALGHAIVSQGSSDDEAHVVVEETLALPLHRYPDPVHLPIKASIASLRSLPAPENVFLGVGSDEVLDLLIRIFVKPGISSTGNDKILITPPTYGMYSVCAQVNDVDVVKVPLRVREGEIDESEGGKNGRFSVDVEAVKKAVIREQRELGNKIKIIFLCSPGNPTGTLIDLDAVKQLLEWEEFKGVVIVDEAYIDFVGSAEDADPDSEIYKRSAAQFIGKYDNVVVTQTLSKSFGLAGIRLGIAIAPIPIVQILANTKAPYNISVPTAHLASKALSPESLSLWRKNVRTLKHNRTFLVSSLSSLSQSTLPDSTLSLGVGPIIGSNDANFVLVRILERGAKVGEVKPDSTRAQKVYKYLAEEVGVVVRYRGNELGCEGALRITVGTEEENEAVLEKLIGALGKI